MATPLINGQAYSFSQVVLNVLGRDVVGVTAVKFSDKQDMQNNYGAGKFPVSRGYGQVKCEASITLEMVEVEALQAASDTGRLQDIKEFDMSVSWVNEGNVLVTHIVHNCRFMENSRDTKTGDMTTEVELPLLVSHITRQ
jgi:hypothetical protein